MSEEKNEQNTEDGVPSEHKPRTGGYFDSLIADFDLDKVKPMVFDHAEDDNDSGEVIIEAVDGITVESTVYESLPEDNDSVVLYDEAEENNGGAPVGTRFEKPPVPEKKSGIIAALFPVKGDSVGEVIRKIVFLIAVIVFIVAAVLLVINLTDSQKSVVDKEKDEEIIVTTVATTVNEFGEVVTVPPTEEEEREFRFSVMEHYKNINPDVVGFIELAGCEIALPIVQTTDNDYYLTHTYYKGKNQAGSIFMDYRCTLTENYVSPNIVLYGHNQRDGTMFGNLKRYKYDVGFYTENPIVTVSTEFEKGEYVIFGFFITNTLAKQDSNGEVFHYHDYIETLANEKTFEWYMKEVEERNQIIPPVDVEYGDRLLVLSTCSNEYSESRFVVMARKLRDGETVDSFDFGATQLNAAAKSIDWNAVFSVPTRPTTTETTTTPVVTETTTSTSRKNNLIGNMDDIWSRFSENAATYSETEETTRRHKKTTAEVTEPPAETEETTKKTKKTQKVTEETTEKTKKTEKTSKTQKNSETEETTTAVTTTETTTTVTTPPAPPSTTPPPPPPQTETVTSVPEEISSVPVTETAAPETASAETAAAQDGGT